MSNSKISALTSASTPLAGTEVLPVVQSSTTKQVSVANLTAGRAVSMLSATAGNVQVSGNTIATTNANGNLTIDPNGTGYTVLVSSTNGTIAQLGDTTSRTYYLKSANVGGFDNDTLINESDSGVGQFQWKNSGATLWTMNRFGNLAPATAGTGIDFAVTSGSGTSELFADYEEGTWTPVPVPTSGSITTYTSSGLYTKVGRQVTLTFTITISNAGTALALSNITGIPFTNTSQVAPGCGREAGVTGAMWQYTIPSGGTTINGWNYANNTAIASSYILYGSVTYSV